MEGVTEDRRQRAGDRRQKEGGRRLSDVVTDCEADGRPGAVDHAGSRLSGQPTAGVTAAPSVPFARFQRHSLKSRLLHLYSQGLSDVVPTVAIYINHPCCSLRCR